jgi:hypothetical protein
MASLHTKWESFSWAVLSTAQEKYYFLCDLCGSSEAPRGGMQARAVDIQYHTYTALLRLST